MHIASYCMLLLFVLFTYFKFLPSWLEPGYKQNFPRYK